MLCINPTCPHTVPPGWEGGLCLCCSYALQHAGNGRRIVREESDCLELADVMDDGEEVVLD